MKVGIVLNYIRHDSTYAALKTAEIIRNLGYSVTFFDKNLKSSRAKLHAYWDDFILSSKEIPFEDWIDDCDVTIWFTYPTNKEVKFLKKNKIPNICVATWDSVDAEVVSTIKGCGRIVCPTKIQTTYFTEYWRLKNVITIPVSCNYPITSNIRKSEKDFKLVVACPGYQIKRVDHSKLFECLYRAMETNSNLNINFLFSNKVASQIKINVTKFEKAFDAGNTLTCVDDPTGWSEAPLIYNSCDAVLWPVQLESFGYVALEAMTMGTPVIAYNFPPMSEFISDTINGFLVECEKRETDLGVGYALHNCDGILNVINKLVLDRKLVDKAKEGTHKAITSMKIDASKAWDAILEEVTEASS